MRPQDLTVEVRDRNLNRKGQVLPRDLNLSAKLRWCGVGEWTLTLPGDHEMVPTLLEPGSGLLVTSRATGAPEVLFSGPTLNPTRKRDQKNPDGTLTFKGMTDEVLLEDALAYPDPQGSADPNAQTKANDTRTGSTEELMRQYVAYNVTADQALAGRVRGFRQYLDLKGVSGGRGVTQTKSPRFQNLLELLQELAIYDGGLGFRVYQEGDLLLFEVVPVRDLRSTIRLDINVGTITSEEITATGPSLTDAIVGGQGEGTDRTMVQRTVPGSESIWMRPIERFFDRRDTDDPVELEQKGDEELISAAGGTSAKVVPSDDQTMQYLTNWRQGDWITVVVGGEERDSVVTEAVLLFDSSKSIVGAAIGDVATFSPENRQTRKQETIDSRLSYLERTGGLPGRLSSTGQQISDWNDATEPGFYWGNNAANGPSGRTAGTVLWDGGLGVVFQEVRRTLDPHTLWSRYRASSGTWTDWVPNGGAPLPIPWVGNGNSPMTIGSTGWAGVPGATRLEMPAFNRDLLADVVFGAEGAASTGYWMIGASIFNDAGTWTIDPTNADPAISSALGVYGIYAPFASATGQQTHAYGSKSVVIPAGVEAIFQLAMRKSTSGANATLHYAGIEVKPVRWL